MATQKEAMLDVLVSVREFVTEFVTPTKKHEKAKAETLRIVNKRISTLNAQLNKYFDNLKPRNIPSTNQGK